MKRFLVAIAALIAALAIGLATMSTSAGATGGNHAAHVATKKKVASVINLTIIFTPATTFSPGSATYSGQVTSANAKCIRGRTVLITHGGITDAQTVTDASGIYSVSVNKAPQSGGYTAFTPKKVMKKKIKGTKKKKTIICLGATSPPAVVP